MSATTCEDPNHEHCEKCSGCITCGCICHLAGEGDAETQPRSGLVHIEFGLQPFHHQALCPKCGSMDVRVSYHSHMILNVGQGEYPCGSWYRSGILTGDVSEHLCLRCSRCQYGWPTQTADTFRLPPEEPDTDLGEEEPT